MTGKERVLILFGADSRLEWGRSYQVAKAFHSLGHAVVYIDLPLGLGKKAECRQSLAPFPVYQPQHGLPCAKLPFLRNLNHRIIASQIVAHLDSINFKPTIIWAYAPYEPQIAKLLKDRYNARRLLHDIADERISLAEALQGKKAAQITMNNEKEIAGYSDFLVVITETLKNTKTHLHKKILVMPNGVDTGMFTPQRELQKPDEYRTIGGKIILYIGALEEWVDLEAMRYAACAAPDLTFMLVGPCKVDLSLFNGVTNIISIGRKPYEAMPAYIQHAEVCILPFRDVEVARNSDPLKVLQYIAMGRPVVSLFYEGCNDYGGHARIARDHAEFASALIDCCSNPVTDSSAALAMIEAKYSWLTLIANFLRYDASDKSS